MARRTLWTCYVRGCHRRRWRNLAICLRCRTSLWLGLYGVGVR